MILVSKENRWVDKFKLVPLVCKFLTPLVQCSGVKNGQKFLDIIYGHSPRVLQITFKFTTRWYGFKGTKVDQSCFNDPVKWIKTRVSEPCPRNWVCRGDSQLQEILQIRIHLSGNSKINPWNKQTTFKLSCVNSKLI